MTAPSDPATRSSDDPGAARAAPLLEPRQRWRLTVAREASRGEEVPSGRDYVARWEQTMLGSGLPVMVLASGRPRIALGAPLPSGCAGDGELLEVWLTQVVPAWAVREGLESDLPAGHRLVGLESVWIGAPALSGHVAAADYEVTLRDDVPAPDLAAAVGRLLASPTLPRERLKGGTLRSYDLRPLVVSLEASGATVQMRTRIHPELGTGRPDEVVASLGNALGRPLAIERIVRRRLLLADDLAPQPDGPHELD